jgi:hypothetical protein
MNRCRAVCLTQHKEASIYTIARYGCKIDTVSRGPATQSGSRPDSRCNGHTRGNIELRNARPRAPPPRLRGGEATFIGHAVRGPTDGEEWVGSPCSTESTCALPALRGTHTGWRSHGEIRRAPGWRGGTTGIRPGSRWQDRCREPMVPKPAGQAGGHSVHPGLPAARRQRRQRSRPAAQNFSRCPASRAKCRRRSARC